LPIPRRSRASWRFPGTSSSPELIAQAFSEANRHTRIFAAHGIHDEVQPIESGERAVEIECGYGSPVEWHADPMPHSACAEETEALTA
jgi:phospholipase/carboxylesterase